MTSATEPFTSGVTKVTKAPADAQQSTEKPQQTTKKPQQTTKKPQQTTKKPQETETPEDAINNAWKAGNYGEIMTNGSEYGDFGKFKSVIPITEEMTNTVEYLKAHGLYDLLVDESPIVAVRVADIGKLTVDALEYTTPIFNAFWDNGKSKPETDRETGEQISTYTSGDYMPKNSREFTDSATINALAENAYGYRFDLTGGYVAEFRRANGCRTIMYIPKGRVELNLG